ncbi:MAG: DUF1761 domain-containing protein [Thermoplasmatota archaeon]
MIELLYAILAAIVTAQVVGFLWYGLLFAKPWMKGMGMAELEEEELKAMQKKAVPGYVWSALMAAGMTAALWYVFTDFVQPNTEQSDAVAGLLTGAIGWLVFHFTATSTNNFFAQRPWSVWAIDTAYMGVQATLYGLYVGLFVGL